MNNKKTKTVLFCPIHPTSFNKMLQIAAELIDDDLCPLFLISNEYTFTRCNELLKNNIDYVGIGSYVEHKVGKTVPIKNKKQKASIAVKTRVYNWVRQLPVIGNWLERREQNYTQAMTESLIKDYKVKQEEVANLFNAIMPKVVIVAGDRHLQYEVVVLSEARKRNIPCYIPPISVTSEPRYTVAQRLTKSNVTYIDKSGELVEKLPNQFYKDTSGQMVSFFPVWMLEPLDRLELLPSHPFVMGQSFSKSLMLSGEHEKKRLLEHGLDQGKIVVTGDPEFDCLYKSLQDKSVILQQLSQKYQLDERKRIVLVSLPQLFEHKLLSHDEHWKVINHICACLQALEVNVLVSLHPKMKLDNYQHLEKEYSLVIIEEPLREVLVVADVFVASQGSSTWLWAVLCGIPCLLCDWYGLDYEDFIDDECGVQIIKQKEQLQVQLNRLFEDEVFYTSQRKKQLAKQHELALFDGRAMERISALHKS